MNCPYHHCGITTSGTVTREGHCPCDECHAGPEDGFPASRIILAGLPDLPGNLPRKNTMCDRWYERAGAHRPWHHSARGCMCGVHGQALPEQHGPHCPVYQYWWNHLREQSRDQWQGAEPGGAETWAP